MSSSMCRKRPDQERVPSRSRTCREYGLVAPRPPQHLAAGRTGCPARFCWTDGRDRCAGATGAPGRRRKYSSAHARLAPCGSKGTSCGSRSRRPPDDPRSKRGPVWSALAQNSYSLIQNWLGPSGRYSLCLCSLGRRSPSHHLRAAVSASRSRFESERMCRNHAPRSRVLGRVGGWQSTFSASA